MKNKYNILIFLCCAINNFSLFATEGALSGLFSVSSTKKVYFSKGNLQYQASTGTWRFAVNQYDIIGRANLNISSTYSGWIDLFGFSSPSTHYGVSSSGNNSDYKGKFIDWGTNSISNGGNTPSQWFTLSSNEWKYLFSSRKDASILFFRATVNNQAGLVVLPDGFVKGSLEYTTGVRNFYINTYTTTQWQSFETLGAVFLPFSGYRSRGSYYKDISGSVSNYETGYWTSTWENDLNANTFMFNTHSYIINSHYARYNGYAVRLVSLTPPPTKYTINFNPNGGSVTPTSKSVTYGATYGTLPTPSMNGHNFVGWFTAANGGTQITSANTVSITANQTLYAHWKVKQFTLTAKAKDATMGGAIGSGLYDYGSTCTITAIPNECSKFVKWSDNDTSNPRNLTVTQDSTLTAIFEKIQFNITLETEDENKGEVESLP